MFTLEKLKEFERRDWKEVRGELHIGNKEIPNWILLFEDSDLKSAHSRFLEVVGPYLDSLDGVNFTVSYKKYQGEELWHVDDLLNNEEISRGFSIGELGARPLRSQDNRSLFSASDSSAPSYFSTSKAARKHTVISYA